MRGQGFDPDAPSPSALRVTAGCGQGQRLSALCQPLPGAQLPERRRQFHFYGLKGAWSWGAGRAGGDPSGLPLGVVSGL